MEHVLVRKVTLGIVANIAKKVKKKKRYDQIYEKGVTDFTTPKTLITESDK